MSNILTKIGAFRKKSIEIEIEGQSFSFYPPRMRTVMNGKLAELAQPFFHALQTLFVDTENDASRNYQGSEEEGITDTFIQGTPPETIELRERHKSEAISNALRVLFNDNTRYQIGELLADSLRDDFSKNEAERAKEARAFIDELEPGVFLQFIKGYFRAIAPLLDASGNSMLSGLQERVKAEVERHLAARAGEEDLTKPLMRIVTDDDGNVVSEEPKSPTPPQA